MAEKKRSLGERLLGRNKEASPDENPNNDAENSEDGIEDADTDKVEASKDSKERGKESVDRLLEMAKTQGVRAGKAVGRALMGIFKGSRDVLFTVIGKSAELKDAVVETVSTEAEALPGNFEYAKGLGIQKVEELKASMEAKKVAKAEAKAAAKEQKALDKELAKNTKLRDKVRKLMEKNPEAIKLIRDRMMKDGLTVETAEGQKVLEGAMALRENAPLVYAEVIKQYPAAKWEIIGNNIDAKVTEVLTNAETKMEDWSSRASAAVDRFKARRKVASDKRAATIDAFIKKMTPPIFEAVANLQAENAEIKAENAEIKARLEAMTLGQKLSESRAPLSEVTPEAEEEDVEAANE